MRQAFNLEQIDGRTCRSERAIFLIAEIDGEAAGYAKLIVDNIEDGITAERPVELTGSILIRNFSARASGRR